MSSHIRLWLGGAQLRISADTLLQKLDKQLPDFVFSSEGLQPPEQAIRLTAKQLARGACWLINRELDKAKSPYPRATPGKKDDVLVYTVRYVLGLFLWHLCDEQWICTYVESADEAGAPAIEITDLVAASTLATAGAGGATVAAPEYAQLAPPATVGAAGDPDPAPGDLEIGDSSSSADASDRAGAYAAGVTPA